jgi:hypothetical protein
LADISGFIDISLMNTITQSSATFIAITAGFFTTKIISLSTEKSRLERRKNEIESELRAYRQKQSEYKKQIDHLLEVDASERVDDFEGAVRAIPPDQYVIASSVDLIRYFREYYGRPPSERETRILSERSAKMLAKINDLKKQKELLEKEYSHLPEHRRPTYVEGYHRIKSDGERTSDTLYSIEENREFHRLDEELRETSSRITHLEETAKSILEELSAVAYPKNALFGFLSFIVFAILGVIIPLTYRLWATSLLDLSKQYAIIVPQLNNANHIVVGLFSLGLAINFCYIALEVYPSFKKPPGKA